MEHLIYDTQKGHIVKEYFIGMDIGWEPQGMTLLKREQGKGEREQR